MPKALDAVTKDATELLPQERLGLAEFLLKSTDSAINSEADAAWEPGIRERIGAIDDHSIAGISYKEVTREAEKCLAR